MHRLPEDRRGDHDGREDDPMSARPLRVVGRPVPRVDGLEKVTGRARYVTDLVIPGMAHARVMRSPYAHARVRRVDVTRARALTGVLAALCGADLTWCEPYYGP
ncbi:MAG: aldehyde oxidase, partial [Candidatus Rokuibacteriota bacterium]